MDHLKLWRSCEVFQRKRNLLQDFQILCNVDRYLREFFRRFQLDLMTWVAVDTLKRHVIWQRKILINCVLGGWLIKIKTKIRLLSTLYCEKWQTKETFLVSRIFIFAVYFYECAGRGIWNDGLFVLNKLIITLVVTSTLSQLSF